MEIPIPVILLCLVEDLGGFFSFLGGGWGVLLIVFVAGFGVVCLFVVLDLFYLDDLYIVYSINHHVEGKKTSNKRGFFLLPF